MANKVQNPNNANNSIANPNRHKDFSHTNDAMVDSVIGTVHRQNEEQENKNFTLLAGGDFVGTGNHEMQHIIKTTKGKEIFYRDFGPRVEVTGYAITTNAKSKDCYAKLVLGGLTEQYIVLEIGNTNDVSSDVFIVIFTNKKPNKIVCKVPFWFGIWNGIYF